MIKRAIIILAVGMSVSGCSNNWLKVGCGEWLGEVMPIKVSRSDTLAPRTERNIAKANAAYADNCM